MCSLLGGWVNALAVTSAMAQTVMNTSENSGNGGKDPARISWSSGELSKNGAKLYKCFRMLILLKIQNS